MNDGIQKFLAHHLRMASRDAAKSLVEAEEKRFLLAEAEAEAEREKQWFLDLLGHAKEVGIAKNEIDAAIDSHGMFLRVYRRELNEKYDTEGFDK